MFEKNTLDFKLRETSLEKWISRTRGWNDCQGKESGESYLLLASEKDYVTAWDMLFVHQ